MSKRQGEVKEKKGVDGCEEASPVEESVQGGVDRLVQAR